MRQIRISIPNNVAATVHFAAISNECTVSEAAACLLFTAVARMTQEEAAQWVQSSLAPYRKLQTMEYGEVAHKEV